MRSLVAVGALAATAAAVVAAPAMADPITSHGKLTRPAAYDIVGVGSESISFITDQLAFNYNKTVGKKHSPADPYIYSWDAVPATNLNDTTQKIILKAGCRRNTRPNGSTAGIGALTSYGNTHYTYRHRRHTVPCVDYARSSRPFANGDPTFGPGGVVFDTLWADAVTYATTSNTNAPNNLTKAQLAEIFNCKVPAANSDPANTWGALLGSAAKAGTATTPIDPIVPQAGSGTLSFWMKTALGLTSTAEPTCGTAGGLTTPQQPEENEGTSKVFLLPNGQPNPNVIYPFSVGAFVAQAYHDGKCHRKLRKGENMFGCDQNGIFHLNGINGTAPTVTPRRSAPVTNPAWTRTPFERFLYVVVPYASKGNHIPAYLNKFFGSRGYFCKQTKVVEAYGFEPTRLCGFTS